GVEHLPHPHRLAGDADGGAVRPVEHGVGVVGERGERDHPERWLKFDGRGLERGPVSDRILPGSGRRAVKRERSHRTPLIGSTASAPSSATVAASRKSPWKPANAATMNAPRSGAMA